ncbi:MAG: primosomal protein N' [Euryarchaeota archaeon]|nr:primosomal protein N' [Euryarchaeota archaeon]
MDKQFFFNENELVGILTTEPINRVLDYYSPDGGCRLGDFVEVFLGSRKVLGCVWSEGSGGYDPSKIKKIKRVLDIEPMQNEMKFFLRRVSDYTLSPISSMLRLALRGNHIGQVKTHKKVYFLSDQKHHKILKRTRSRTRLMDFLVDHKTEHFSKNELSSLSGVSISVIQGLIKKDIIFEKKVPINFSYPKLFPEYLNQKLSTEQSAVVKQLKASLAEQVYSTTLLKGVTGSGKTEVYLELVAEVLRLGKQVLVLLPEIALTSAFTDKVKTRFGNNPAEWHSRVSKGEKYRCRRMIASGDVQLVVGARSALYLPFKELGLIVVDEEHDSSFKQEDGILYNARDMAVLRASLNEAMVVLASATPSLETWVNAKTGKYNRLNLESRYGAAKLPEISCIDMRREKLSPNTWISKKLIDAVSCNLESGEQSLLFLNRRGYAPITICQVCGFQVGCEKCDARMTLHNFRAKLLCHQCGDTKPLFSICPNCKASGSFNALGPGVERIAEEASKAFPDAKLAILSSDILTPLESIDKIIDRIERGDVDIIIGTQLVAKGHNFPHLSLVGVIDADLGLQGADLRASEKTFQLIKQVSGRAGRIKTQGVALLQTYQPEHPVMKAILSNDDEKFWETEVEQRKEALVPPFGSMAGIVISGTDLQQITQISNQLAINLGPLKDINAMVFGPAPAPIARIRGRHRIRLLVKVKNKRNFQKALGSWAGQFKLPGNVRLSIDIDPQTFY